MLTGTEDSLSKSLFFFFLPRSFCFNEDTHTHSLSLTHWHTHLYISLPFPMFVSSSPIFRAEIASFYHHWPYFERCLYEHTPQEKQKKKSLSRWESRVSFPSAKPPITNSKPPPPLFGVNVMAHYPTCHRQKWWSERILPDARRPRLQGNEHLCSYWCVCVCVKATSTYVFNVRHAQVCSTWRSQGESEHRDGNQWLSFQRKRSALLCVFFLMFATNC